MGRKPCFAAAPKASAKLQYLSKTADFDVGKLFFSLVLLFFRVAKLQRLAIRVCGGVFAYPELKRAAGGDSSAVGGDSFVGRSQPKPNARARIRVSGVFRFSPSPLHPMGANC